MSSSIPLVPQGGVVAIGIPTSQDYPRLVATLPYFEGVPLAELIAPSVLEATEALLPSLLPPYVDDAVDAAVQAQAVLLVGGTMTGPLYLSPTLPTQPDQAVSMAYVDMMVSAGPVPEVPPTPIGQIWARETGQWVPVEQATGIIPEAPTTGQLFGRNGQSQSWSPVLPLAGGTMTGALTLAGNAVAALQPITLQQLGASLGAYVPLAGSVSIGGPLTMSGLGATFTLSGNAATNLQAVPLQQLTSTLASYLPLAGGAVTGPLNVATAALPGGAMPSLNANNLVLSPANGHVAFNCWLNAAATQWTYTTAGPAAIFYLAPGTGVMTMVVAPTGAAGAAVPLTVAWDVTQQGSFRANNGLMALGSGTVGGTVGSWAPGGAGSNVGFWNSNSVINFGYADGNGVPIGSSAQLDIEGDFTILGVGTKPGGGPWAATSDARVKQDVADYGTGVDAVCALRPRSYRYNGEGGTQDDGRTYYGLTAQEAQEAMPELVFPMAGDLLGVDAGPLTFALVNCIKELDARLRQGGL